VLQFDVTLNQTCTLFPRYSTSNISMLCTKSLHETYISFAVVIIEIILYCFKPAGSFPCSYKLAIVPYFQATDVHTLTFNLYNICNRGGETRARCNKFNLYNICNRAGEARARCNKFHLYNICNRAGESRARCNKFHLYNICNRAGEARARCNKFNLYNICNRAGEAREHCNKFHIDYVC
jgi:hypothetical protein